MQHHVFVNSLYNQSVSISFRVSIKHMKHFADVFIETSTLLFCSDLQGLLGKDVYNLFT